MEAGRVHQDPVVGAVEAFVYGTASSHTQNPGGPSSTKVVLHNSVKSRHPKVRFNTGNRGWRQTLRFESPCVRPADKAGIGGRRTERIGWRRPVTFPVLSDSKCGLRRYVRVSGNGSLEASFIFGIFSHHAPVGAVKVCRLPSNAATLFPYKAYLAGSHSNDVFDGGPSVCRLHY